MKTRLLLIASLVLACSSNKPDDEPVPSANLCATPGSTYLSSLTLQSGNCPADIPDTVVNITEDGTVPQGEGIVCASLEQDGCTGRGSSCVYKNEGCTNTYSFKTTFTDDGASADGIVTMNIRCPSESCIGTYLSHYTRLD
jgi:hypothetical protein